VRKLPFANGIYHYMLPFMTTKIPIDRAGRMVLPKPLREKLHLQAGDDLEVECNDDQITLRPARTEALLIKDRGIWVYTGEVADIDIVDFIDEQREKRSREFLG
jgi:AbrB family looped-hinge helix DNA binding protein